MSLNQGIKLTILVENTVRLPGLKAEHGWSVHVETGPGSLLFDTGQSSQVVENAALLDLDLKKVGQVVISHGHYDHTGGLPAVLGLNSGAKVFAHPDIFKTRFYQRPGGSSREIGITCQDLDRERFVFTREPVTLFPGCMTTGAIPIGENHVTTEGNFYEDREATQRDLIQDDQALILESQEGLIVLLGCCHAGLMATLEQVLRLTGKSKIFMVLGGMHLVDASKELVEQTIKTLKDYSVSRIGLGHCTGYQGAITLQTAFPAQCFPCTAGVRLRV